MPTDEMAKDLGFEFVVVGHAIDSNALGRAISMAMVAEKIGPTRLLAFGSGPLWKGAGQFPIETERLSKHWKREIESVTNRGPRTVFWLAKGISPLDHLASHISRTHPDALIVLDLDDDDAGLAEAFTRQSFLNKVKLHPLRRGSASRVRKAQARIAGVAHGFTFSSNSLASVYPKTFQPKARIPHVREDVDSQKTGTSSPLPGTTFGSLGTLRPHKGSGLLLELMRENRDLTLVTFADCGLGTPESSDTNWIELPPDTPLHEAYAHVDVSLIPISDKGPGAQFQLPAKLVDSMRAGVPVLASSTPAIDEIASDGYTPLPETLSAGEVAEQIRALSRGHSGQLARRRFEDLLTPAAAARELESLLAFLDQPR